MNKTAQQIPRSTTTAKLEQLSIYSTAEELIELHFIGQLSRLSSTPTGRTIFATLNLNASIPVTTGSRFHGSLTIRPLPRIMHPAFNKQRREHRARALTAMIHSTTVYVDAASYDGRTHTLSLSLTVCTGRPAEAEEAAIALTHWTPLPSSYRTRKRPLEVTPVA